MNRDRLAAPPLPFAYDRESRAVDDEMEGLVSRDTVKCDIEVLAAPGECRVVRGFEIEAHERQDQSQEALCLTERQLENQTKREGRLDRQIRELPLVTSPAGRRRLPRVNRILSLQETPSAVKSLTFCGTPA